jgi:hypothetical protein
VSAVPLCYAPLLCVTGLALVGSVGSPYNPGMRDGRWGLRADQFSRIGRWRPTTYWQAWLSAVLFFALPITVIWSIFGWSNGWQHPWPELWLAGTGSILVVGGLTQSLGVYWRRRRTRAAPQRN